MQNISEEQLKYRIAITMIEGIGDVLAKNLVSYCGSVEAVFSESKRSLEKIPGIGPVTADSIVSHKIFDRAEKEIRFIQKNKITALFYLDKDYPARLKNCNDNPVMLYYKGVSELNHSRMIAIVGTRSATDYGKSITEQFVMELKSMNAIVVSGLAYGIDITAHKAALKNKMETIGVFGHGLDRVYPALHKSVAEKMMEQGGLLTEFMSGTNPDAQNFPSRNRIVAGICDAVIVIEAARSGGALITAEIANSYNRDVFAVPGRTIDNYSEGCNYLIKTNKAALIESAKDISYIMGWEIAKKKEPKKQRELFVELSDDEQSLVSLLNRHGKLDIDTITTNMTLPVSKISSTLLNLEFKGVLKSLPGKVYELT